MTAKVRVEKADPTDWILRVQIQDRNSDGEWVNVGEPKILDYPSMLSEDYIWDSRRLIIEEVGSNGMMYVPRADYSFCGGNQGHELKKNGDKFES